MTSATARSGVDPAQRGAAGGPADARRPLELRQRSVTLSGSRLARALLRLAGWRVLFDGLPAAQGVAVVYPHTSNWDFVVGLLAKWAIGIPVTFWGKDSLFRIPLLGRWMRWVGGMPVDRSSAHGVVGQMAGALAEARRDGHFLWLALAPEGTRRLAHGWRSGFYHVALAAEVPLGLVALDYARREVGFKGFLRLGGDPAADVAAIAAMLSACTGLHPAQASPIRLHP